MNPGAEAFWPPVDRVLVADDERAARISLVYGLEKEGFDVVSVDRGDRAREVMLSDAPPQVLLLDWNMPGLSGPEVCRWVRGQSVLESCYLILVTARDTTEDMLEGMAAGADDFVRKPFRTPEVVARVRAGRRLAQLQTNLANRLVELESALTEVRQLRGLIPICSHCHSIRTESASWQKLEAYIEQHSEAQFSHSICDACMRKYYDDPGDVNEEAA